MPQSYQPPLQEAVVYVTSRWIWLPLVALAVASCAEGVPTTPDLSATDIDVGDDAADAEPDTPDLEEVTAIETGPDARLGGFGDPCDEDDECESRYCIDTDEAGICTELCDETCPDGFVCRVVANAGNDAVRLCVPVHDDLCDRCSNDNECGGVDNLCLEQQNGTFCATRCDDSSCPEGYGCNTQTGPDGDTEVCEPLDGYCNRIRLTRSLLVPGSEHGESGPYRHSGYVLILPHEAESPSFRLSGGFR
jgi:hypothetical protein